MAALWVAPAGAMFMQPEAVPVDRLVENLRQQVEQRPESAKAHYQLGRAHYIAVVFKSAKVGIFEADDDERFPRVADDFLQDWVLEHRDKAEGGIKDPLEEHAFQKHYKGAIKHLLRATALAPDNGKYHLTLASAYEQGSATLLAVNATQPADGGDAQDNDWHREAKRQALKHYERAYSLTVDEELQEELPLQGLSGFVSHEAGTGFLRLAKDFDDVEPQRIDEVQAAVKTLKDKPQKRITPIIFSLEATSDVSTLIDRDTTVSFNLDGSGRAQRWRWVEPDTGLLVWDPEQTGKITSGRQLFGSVTWWLFWDTGYEALAALDDDGDGELRGAELAGIAGWFDRNQNGVSDPGEVTPVDELGIEAIAVEATGKAGRHPTNPRGLELEGGRRLPTWDWMAEPASSSEDTSPVTPSHGP
jgi:tetratricopeptide (TPR) repeat protein